MQAVASQSRADRASGTKRPKAEAHAAGVAPRFDQAAALRDDRVVRRKSCACGGSCPHCRAQSLHSAAPGRGLSIGALDDPAERQADRMADRVMRMPDFAPAHEARSAGGTSRTNLLRRKCACGGSAGSAAECDDCAAERKGALRRRAADGAGPHQAPPIVHDVLRAPGRALDASTRAFFEPRFGQDFSGVRVHLDGRAAESARAVHALAYTVGTDIVFGAGQYAPNSSQGRHVLAHELAHVVQQGDAAPQSARRDVALRRLGDQTQIPAGLGCQVATTSPVTITHSVMFANGVSTLDVIDRLLIGLVVANWRRDGANQPVRVDGYASERGPDPLNWRLSCQRAMNVVNELEHPSSGMPGIPAAFITFFMQGETIDFGTEDQNRRATISVWPALVIPPGVPPAPQPIQIVGAETVGPLGPDQRRAAASCDVNCRGLNIGTLHAMGLFFHQSRGAPLPSNVGADGIGSTLHFMRNGTTPVAGSDCANCTFHFIQVINTNATLDPRGKDFVDNVNSAATPFYDVVALSGAGTHTIPTAPGGWPDAGRQITTTQSMYDTPFRTAAALAPLGATATDFQWNAEACVVCQRPAPHPDLVLGCATYGFSRTWNAATASYDPVQAIAPGCLGGPSAHFVTTVQNDPTTSLYYFEDGTAPAVPPP